MLSEELKTKLGVALNEADLLSVELDEVTRRATVVFSVLTLPDVGEAPIDRRVCFVLSSVGRLVASLRLGTWNDPDADVASFAVDELTAVVERFGGQPIYGWEFFDPAESDLESWSDRLSLDWGDRRSGMTNRLFLFQEGVNEHLDLCLWFDDLEIFDAAGQPLPVTVFCDGGQRWWTAMRQGDPRVAGEGIVPLGSKETE